MAFKGHQKTSMYNGALGLETIMVRFEKTLSPTDILRFQNYRNPKL